MAEGIQRTSTRAPRKRKKRVNQIPFALGLLVIIIVAGVLLGLKQADLALYWMIGLGFGWVLQRSRFCFTASMRDPYLTKSTSVTRAVLIAFALTSIVFTAIKYGAFKIGAPIPGQAYIAPISIATGIGAFMFGVGMVIAGGCASGTLMRIGEGFWMQALSLLFFIIGSLWGAHDMGWWRYNFVAAGPKVFLPDLFGGQTGFAWIGGLALNLLIITVIYVIAQKYEKKHNPGEDEAH